MLNIPIPNIVIAILTLFVSGIYIGVRLEYKYRSNNDKIIDQKEYEIRKLKKDLLLSENKLRNMKTQTSK